jgi:CHASE2 domain-containing sensor protein
MGVMAYLMQVGMSAEDLVALEEAERRLFETTPSWVTGAFAIGVFGGALGCLSLLLRNSLAIPLLAISLVAVLVQMGYSVFLSDALDVYGSQALVMPGLVIIFAVLLLWFALFSRKTGWLR